MWLTSLFLTYLMASGSGNTEVRYLPTIQARWEASDLVCIGNASNPVLTGIIQSIDGADRDQLSADVTLERCLKGRMPSASQIRVLGNYVTAPKPGGGRLLGFAYSGPPLGFVHKGRNLLFLRKRAGSDEFLVTVPILQTSIPLADSAPEYPPSTSPHFEKLVITREIESAMLESENGVRQDISETFSDPLLSDQQYIYHLLEYLGPADGFAELSRFSNLAPLAIQRDIAVTLLGQEHQEFQPMVISLLLDQSAPASKRWNAALSLGNNGSQEALEPLRRVIQQPAGTDQLNMLHDEAEYSLKLLEQKLESLNKQKE